MTMRPNTVRRNVPHWVYRIYDTEGVLLYIGCTNSPVSRISGHRHSQTWGDQIAHVRYTVFPNRRKALDVERAAIWYENPLHNIRRVPPMRVLTPRQRVTPPYVAIADIRAAHGDEFADRCIELASKREGSAS